MYKFWANCALFDKSMKFFVDAKLNFACFGDHLDFKNGDCVIRVLY